MEIHSLKAIKALSWILFLVGLLFGSKDLCYAEPRIFLTQPPDGLVINVLPSVPRSNKVIVVGTISGISRSEIDHVIVYLGRILGPLSIPEVSHDRIPPQDLAILNPSVPTFTFMTDELGNLSELCTHSACDFIIFAQLVYRSEGRLKTIPSIINDPASKDVSRIICVDKTGPDRLEIDSPRDGEVFSSRV